MSKYTVQEAVTTERGQPSNAAQGFRFHLATGSFRKLQPLYWGGREEPCPRPTPHCSVISSGVTQPQRQVWEDHAEPAPHWPFRSCCHSLHFMCVIDTWWSQGWGCGGLWGWKNTVCWPLGDLHFFGQTHTPVLLASLSCAKSYFSIIITWVFKPEFLEMLIGCPLVRSLEKFKTQLLPYHGLRALRITYYKRKENKKTFSWCIPLSSNHHQISHFKSRSYSFGYLFLFQKVW